MKKVYCEICEKEPGSHSLIQLDDIEGVKVFYTSPAKATKFNDKDGILAHYSAVLDENGENPWIWVFDSKDFGWKHYLEINVGIALAKMINEKYSKNLQKIVIINPTFYINMVYQIVIPFLSADVKNRIQIITS